MIAPAHINDPKVQDIVRLESVSKIYQQGKLDVRADVAIRAVLPWPRCSRG